MPGVPRVVFDTVVFVRCLLNPHSPAGRLVFQNWDRYELILSRAILEEILEVLSRPEIVRKYPINRIDLKGSFEALDRASIVEVEAVAAVSRDPKDDKFIAAAMAAGARYLVSEDKDLTDLVEVEDVKILRVATFLELIQPGADTAR